MALRKKPKNKTPKLSTIKAKAWDLFSEWVRRKHADEDGWGYCYTCGKGAHWKDLQCGHAIPGRHNAVLLDAEICRLQCWQCNNPKHGVYHIFTTRLIEENGKAWWDAKLAGSNIPKKISRSDYEEIIADLKQKIEAL